MNTMKWLVKREFWEHKGGFFWAPLLLGALISLIFAIVLATSLAMGNTHTVEINGMQVTTSSAVGSQFTVEQKHEIVDGIASGYMIFAVPAFAVLTAVGFFFCLGALFDERKDRSVLFWKSLPVSDTATVCSKVALALVVAPVITLVLGTATSLLALLMVSVTTLLSGVHGMGQVFATPDFYLAPLQIAGMLPIYFLWALPTVGWLMMVSAWSNSKPFLWAVIAPLVGVMLLQIFNAVFNFGWNVQWFSQHIVGRGLFSLLPGSWFFHHHDFFNADDVMHTRSLDWSTLLNGSWSVLATPDLWIGVAAGVAMLYAAIRLRRWRDEG